MPSERQQLIQIIMLLLDFRERVSHKKVINEVIKRLENKLRTMRYEGYVEKKAIDTIV